MTSHQGKDQDMDMVNCVLMTYHSFVTPDKLLTKLIERYHVPLSVNVDERHIIQHRSFSLFFIIFNIVAFVAFVCRKFYVRAVSVYHSIIWFQL